MPAVTKRGPQSQPNWHCCLRMTVQRPTGSLMSRGLCPVRCVRIYSMALPNRISSSFSRAQERFDRPATAEKHIVRAGDLATVEPHGGNRIESFGHEFHDCFGEQRFGAVNEVRYSQSRSSIHCQIGFVGAPERIRDQPMPKQIAVDASRNQGRAPRRTTRGVAKTPRRRGERKLFALPITLIVSSRR